MTGGSETEVVFLKRGQKVKSLINALNPLILQRAYQSFLPIKAAKFDDIKQLLRFVHLPEIVTFYNALKADSAVQKTILKTNMNKICLHVSSLFRFVC